MKILNLDYTAIKHAFDTHDITVAVYGLGKMGLPVAAVFADAGAKVIGVDINPEVVDTVNKGECPIVGEPDLAEITERNVKSGRLSATTDGVKAAQESDVMIILVPSLLDADKNPDLSAVKSVCMDISRGLSKGDLVILETTVPPRTTTDLVLKLLEKSRLKRDEFGLAFCPERTSSGRAIRDIKGAYPKVIGGIDKESANAAEAIYSIINEKGTVTMSDTTAAEMTKLFEGLYRDVNIALSNELEIICKELNLSFREILPVVNEVFDEDNNRYPFNLHQPGAGVGGHCIPVYPYFVTKTTKSDTSLLQTARKINDSMPFVVVSMITDALEESGIPVEKANILLLGLSFRGGVKETANSPAIPIMRKLQDLKANVYVYDPMFSEEEIQSFGVAYGDTFHDMDCIAIITDHKEIKAYDWDEIGQELRRKIIIDGRMIVDPEKMQELGYLFKGIGYSEPNIPTT
ncbi:MAG: nucleotide sugar dehydrogenase [Dehalococcoidales bacterium]|nr:nucleotide sugar dehydrogenase [Dehalococcoidales bacterium]